MVSIAAYFAKQLIIYNVLSEGNFELSGGSVSTYYYEFEKFNDGKALNSVGFSFLSAAKDLSLDYEVVYGTAYKGIFVALAMTSYAWERDYRSILPVVVERKESKDRNNKGLLIGASIEGKKVLLVDDVATSFGSLKKSLDIIKGFNTKQTSILVGVDRSGVKDPRIDGIRVNSIITHEEFIKFLQSDTGRTWRTGTL